jgi:hypothetical protein
MLARELEEILEHWPEGGDIHGGDGYCWLDHRPFYQIDTFPGVIGSLCEALNVYDADNGRC